MDDSIRQYLLYLFIFVFIVFAIITIIDIYNINLNPKITKKKLIEVVTIEGLNNMDIDSTNKFNLPIAVNPAVDFCKSNIGANDMQEKCGELTNINCNKTNCCVWLNNSKCVPGNEDGPTFKTDKSNNKIEVNNYYYQTKCYGKCS